MRTLTAGLIAELGLTITKPGYLVSIGFSTTTYISSIGTLDWGGHTWIGDDIRVEGLTREQTVAKSARISIGNLESTYTALVLLQGVADKAVKIYTIYAGAPTETVLEFSGAGDSAEIGDRIVINLVGETTRNAFAPRRRIGPAVGVNQILPVNTVIDLGGTGLPYILERYPI